MSDEPRIESKERFGDTPQGIAKRWDVELTASDKALEKWWGEGDEAVDEFLGEGQGGDARLNLYYSDVITRGAQLYGSIPKVRARRRFADANDDVARVSAEALERLLNTDIEREDDGYREALASAVGDWLMPGLGQVRLRYVARFETVPEVPAITRPDPVTGEPVELAPAVPETQRKTFEDVETDHVHWKDLRWSPCRTWAEVRWGAIRVPMTREQFIERFGEEKAKFIQLADRRTEGKGKDDDQAKDVWARAEVWEIWSREDRKVYWHVKGCVEILDVQDDPLGLPGFFPFPKPLAANLTSKRYVPRPTYALAKPQYREAHELTLRIRNLARAIKVAGLYDKSFPELERLLTEACENKLLPAASLAALAEKGGVANAIAFLPIAQFVEALVQLVQERNLVIAQLHQITGQSDIMRGQAEGKATATEQRIKARFGSTRIQMEQNELARFASDAQRIRAAIIAQHFDPETIVQRANLEASADADLAAKAVELLKSEFAMYRVEVDAESLAMTDYDAVKNERVEFLQAMTTYLGEVAKIAPVAGAALPYLLELGKHALAGFRGAAQLEGVFDKMIEAAKQPRPPQPDPRAEAAQVQARAKSEGAQLDLQVKRAEHGMRMQELAAETQAHLVERALPPPAPGGEAY